MKATLDTKELRDALRLTGLVGRSSLPITSHTVAAFSDGKAVLTSTDLNKSITIEVPAKTDKPFAVLLPRATMAKFLQGNGQTEIEFDTSINVKRDEGIAKLHSVNPEEFPPAPHPGDIPWSALDAKFFIRMLDIVIPGCATEDSRPILTGILFQNGAMVSADGFCLRVVKNEKLAFGLENDVIVPATTASKIKRLFGKAEQISVAVNNNIIFFKSEGVILTTTLIQGNFPSYEVLLPPQCQSRITMSAPLLAQRLNMIDEKQITSGIVHLKSSQTVVEHLLTLTASCDDEITYGLSLPIKIEKGETTIAFNYKHMLDAIKPFSIVNLETTSAESPGKFTGDIEGVIIVVMPMFVLR